MVTHPLLSRFVEGGGLLLTDWQPQTLLDEVGKESGHDIVWRCTTGAEIDLRVLHYRKAGRDFYLLVNEGETALAGRLSLAAAGSLEQWDPLSGTTRSWPSSMEDGRSVTEVRLARRQSVILMIDPNGEPATAAPMPPQPGAVVQALNGPWQAVDVQGTLVPVACPGDWSQVTGWETFAGTLIFSTHFPLAETQTEGPLFLDLGTVGDIAEVLINEELVGVCAWAPYCFRIDTYCHHGVNTLTVKVTNSIANYYEGIQMPSGILGPVRLFGGW